MNCHSLRSDIGVMKHIVNHLEGGTGSFKHKMFIYNDIVEDSD